MELGTSSGSAVLEPVFWQVLWKSTMQNTIRTCSSTVLGYPEEQFSKSGLFGRIYILKEFMPDELQE